MAVVISSSIEIGSFDLAGKFNTLDGLLKRLAIAVPTAFAVHHLTDAVFTRYSSQHWGDLVFHHDAFTWRVGVQFIKFPLENGSEVLAIIRYGGSANSRPRDPQKLSPLIPTIYQAMLEAVEV